MTVDAEKLIEQAKTAFGAAVRYAGLRMKAECEATFPVFDAALDALADAVERLRADRDEARERGQNLVDAIGMEREMRKDAEADRDRLAAERDDARDLLYEANVKLADAEADRDRLAAALRALDAVCPKWPRGSTWTVEQEKALKKVRAALAAVAERDA